MTNTAATAELSNSAIETAEIAAPTGVVERIIAAGEEAVTATLDPDYRSNGAPAPVAPVTVEPTLDKSKVESELTKLRSLHATNTAANATATKALDQTVQKRLNDFLAQGYPQALELIRDENRTLLTELLGDVGLIVGHGNSKLMAQVAFLQMAVQGKDKKWSVPARRHERIGNLYRIFLEWKWEARDVLRNIKDHEGTSKIIQKDKDGRIDFQAEKDAKRRAETVRAHVEKSSVVVPISVDPKHDGEWRLALVSVHDDGVRVHTLVGQSDDKQTAKLRDAFCAEEFVHLSARLLQSGEAI